MLGKRGDMELQFNWIFVFIVGALIIVVTVGFITTQKKNSDILISNQLIRYTRSVITISGASPGKAEPQVLMRDIGLSCDPKACTRLGCASDIYVMPRSLNAKIDTKVEAIFGPAVIKGSNLSTWSMEWDMPYHVSNFLYLTSDQVRYVFVKTGDSETDKMLDELYEEMPSIMGQKEKAADASAIKNRNNYKVRLIFGKLAGSPDMPSSLSGMQAKDLTAIQVIPDTGGGFRSGTIRFYQKSATGFSEVTPSAITYYAGKPTVYGAVFSDSKDIYECNMRKSRTRLGVISDLYQRKLSTLNNDPSVNLACRMIYDTASGPINELISAWKTPPDDIPAANLLDDSDKVAAANNALKLKSCPLLY